MEAGGTIMEPITKEYLPDASALSPMRHNHRQGEPGNMTGKQDGQTARFS
ncbi:Hypothetical protein GbCGDNIH9_8616 [Granulibacter bethesdensis]|uniref:Uncharacterized protein n=1 Tax=Granulibacter bethesdensis TaxID=364410 RepID=A0AAC9KBN8_9PROT|nr:Hypothetical protein GbCGDNIH9_8616 [Granulibacter bethesdensis]APH62525.1 Hypothetical protein GbCGDNIH8_8616 [Granulibacter bethesdensis]